MNSQLINELFSQPVDITLITRDRGPNIDSCDEILSYPEFNKYYFVTRVGLDEGVISALQSDHIFERIAIAYRNEIIYNLMCLKGINYEAAYNFTDGLIVPDGIYGPIDKDKLYINLRAKLADLDSVNFFYRSIMSYYDFVKDLCEENGIKFISN